jgi:hypothetical protein
MINALNLASAVSAFIAAALWLVSATVQARPRDRRDSSDWMEASIISDGFDVIESGKLQQKWSRRGAWAAASAALFQAVAAASSIQQ